MTNGEIASMMVFLAVFAATGGIGLLIYFWLQRDQRRAIARLRGLADEQKENEAPAEPRPMLEQVLPSAGKLLMTPGTEQTGYWQRRLRQAGYGQPDAFLAFLGIKLVLLLTLPAFTVLTPLALGWLPLNLALMAGTLAIGLSFFGPNACLHWRIGKRQRLLRGNLPDALDMIVLCLEGGVSMPLAIQRVTEDLKPVFPDLALEMGVVQREIELGIAAGEALQHFAERCNLEEVRGLAAVLTQSERFGASVAKSLRLHADAWRVERRQQIEERAQRAAVLILFPMLICIFPAIFIVTLAPAVFQMAGLFSGGR